MQRVAATILVCILCKVKAEHSVHTRSSTFRALYFLETWFWRQKYISRPFYFGINHFGAEKYILTTRQLVFTQKWSKIYGNKLAQKDFVTPKYMVIIVFLFILQIVWFEISISMFAVKRFITKSYFQEVQYLVKTVDIENEISFKDLLQCLVLLKRTSQRSS